MAGGGVPAAVSKKNYPGKFTSKVFIACFIAATGGLIFGYDLGISGGVTSMNPFLKKFFPKIYKKQITMKPSDNQYCKFDSQILTLFTSSLYLAAFFASMVASTITRVFGRRLTMMFGGLLFAGGAILNGFAEDIYMLIFGRMLLGFGIGFANQAVPIYLSEMAPFKHRGAMNIMFQMSITIGILVANFLNFFTAKIKGGWGWRVSLGGAVIPGLIIFLGSFFLSDTPNSLLERNKYDKAKDLLRDIRGVHDVDEEFNDLVAASEASKLVKNPWKVIRQRKYRPPLCFSIMIPLCQQFTGMNVFVFYAPVLFKTMGFGDDASLMSAAITSLFNAAATLVSIFTVDKFGRKFLFIEGGIQILCMQIVLTTLVANKFGTSGNPGEMPMWYSVIMVAAMCIFIMAYAWSWGPLGWLVPSEIHPLETRPAAQSITVGVNMMCTFFVAQVFTTMLCHLKFGLFIFFGCCVICTTSFIIFFFPETRGVPIEEMSGVWKKHPYWGKFLKSDEEPSSEKQQQQSQV